MVAVAALASGVFAAFAVAAATGSMPTLRPPRPDGEGGGERRIEGLLRRAGVGWTAGQAIALSVGGALAATSVVVATTPVWPLAVVPAAIVGAVPTTWLRRRAAARTRAIRQAWPDALARISGTVRAGRPLSQALIEVSISGPPALMGPLEGLAARIQTVGLAPALHAVRDAVAEPVTDRVVEVLVLAHAEGGRIVLEVLDDLQAGVTAEVAAAEEVETLALEGRLNARLVFALPWVVLVLLTARAGPFQDFYTSAAGAVVIVLGAAVSLVGTLLVGRLSAVPEDPRVLIDGGGS